MVNCAASSWGWRSTPTAASMPRRAIPGASPLDWNGTRRRSIDLNQGGFDDSYTGDLALDAERGILYAVDQANFRVAVIDAALAAGAGFRARGPAAVRAGAFAGPAQALRHQPRACSNTRRSPAPTRKQAREHRPAVPGLRIPQPRSRRGRRARRPPAARCRCPGWAIRTSREANSLAVVDVSDPAAPKVETFIRTGPAVRRGESRAAAARRAWLAAADRVFVSNANDDSITVIDAAHQPRRGGNPHPHSRAWRTCAACCPSGMALPRNIRLAAGGRGRHQCRRRDRHAPASASSGTFRRRGFPRAWRSMATPSSWPTRGATARGRTSRVAACSVRAAGDRSRSFPLPRPDDLDAPDRAGDARPTASSRRTARPPAAARTASATWS